VSPISTVLRKAVAELVLETTSEGVWLIDADSRTSFVNERTASLLGYSVEEMLGVDLFVFMDEEGRQICRQNVERRRSGIQEQHEFKFMRKDGTPVWTLLATNPVYDRRGQYAGALAMVADLTHQKNREERLSARVEALERQAAEAQAAALQFERLAATDALTGLHNRRHFEERLSAEISRCRRHHRRFCLLMIDLDRFKSVNDRFGHQTGDDLLRAAANALHGPLVERSSGFLRVSDVVARCGGDELGIIAAETDLEGGMTLAERVLGQLRTASIPVSTGEHVAVTASIGVACFPFHAADERELVAAADRAMYTAKNAGGCRVCLAEPKLP
jgi:diguanylate cyclase (GGDEF)-like protein/PAS domain S-box-containing protein